MKTQLRKPARTKASYSDQWRQEACAHFEISLKRAIMIGRTASLCVSSKARYISVMARASLACSNISFDALHKCEMAAESLSSGLSTANRFASDTHCR